MSPRPLRVGLLVNDTRVAAWFYRAVERVIQTGDAEIVLLIRNAAEPPAQSPWKRLWENRRRLVYYAFKQLDRRLFHPSPDALALKDLKTFLPGVPVLDVHPVQKRYSDTLTEADLEAIRVHDLDVLVRGGFRILKSGILRAAKYGIWSYHHGDNRVNRGAPPAYWETVQSWPATGTVLQILGDALDGGRVLYRSWNLTNALSPTLNYNALLWTSASFLSRVLHRLSILGEDAFFKEVDALNPSVDPYDSPLYKTPSNAVALIHGLRLLGRWMARAVQRFFIFDQWHLRFTTKPMAEIPIQRYQTLMPSRDRFWADPHIVRHEGRHFIFIEEWMRRPNRGRISVIEMDDAGKALSPKVVLDQDIHLSYPHVFAHEGQFYMIPETQGRRTVELYVCEDFPLRWTRKMTLMENVSAVDATVFFHEGRWWLFMNRVENPGGSPYTELFLYSADTLETTDWIPHPQNPIVSDAHTARPAGPLFVQDGKIYRPSQNCTGRYGREIQISEVLVLNEQEYLERCVGNIAPHWEGAVQATHTLATTDGLTVIDACQTRRKAF